MSHDVTLSVIESVPNIFHCCNNHEFKKQKLFFPEFKLSLHSKIIKMSLQQPIFLNNTLQDLTRDGQILLFT